MFDLPPLSASTTPSSPRGEGASSVRIQFDHLKTHEFTVKFLKEPSPPTTFRSLSGKIVSESSNSKDWIPLTVVVNGKETKILIKATELKKKLGIGTKSSSHKTQTKEKSTQERVYIRVKQLYLKGKDDLLKRELPTGSLDMTVSRFLSHFYDVVAESPRSLNADEFQILALHIFILLSESPSDLLNSLSEDKLRILLAAHLKALKDPETAKSLPFLTQLLTNSHHSLKKEDYGEIVRLRTAQLNYMKSLPGYAALVDKEPQIWLTLFRFHRDLFSTKEAMSDFATIAFQFISDSLSDTPLDESGSVDESFSSDETGSTDISSDTASVDGYLSDMALDGAFLEKVAATLTLFHKENRSLNRRDIFQVAESIQLSTPTKDLLTVRFYFHLQENSLDISLSRNPKKHPAWLVAEHCVPFYDCARHPELKDLPVYLDILFSQETAKLSEKSARLLAELLVEILKQNPHVDSNTIVSLFQKMKNLLSATILVEDGKKEPFSSYFSVREALEITKIAFSGISNKAYKINNMPLAVIVNSSGQVYIKSQLDPGRGHFLSYSNPTETSSCYLSKNDDPALSRSLKRNFDAFQALKGIEGVPQLRNNSILLFRESDNTFYRGFFTSLTQGPSLASLLEKGKLTLNQKLEYAVQAVDILKHLHERKILHTNLLSKYFYIDATTAKLALFNIDSHINLKTSPNLVDDATTLNRSYFPPESIAWAQTPERDEDSLRKILIPAYDVWSLGNLFSSLFFGKKAEEMLATTASEFSLEYMVKEMLAEDPTARPTLEDVLRLLSDFSSRLEN